MIPLMKRKDAEDFAGGSVHSLILRVTRSHKSNQAEGDAEKNEPQSALLHAGLFRYRPSPPPVTQRPRPFA